MQVSSQVQETANRLKTQGTEPSEPLYKALAQLLFDSAALQAGQSRLFLLTLVQGLQDPLKASVFNSLTQAVSRLPPVLWLRRLPTVVVLGSDPSVKSK